MNSEPLTLLLKLVARHTQSFAHGPQLLCLVQIHKLIGWLVASMLAGVAGHPVIVQKVIGCNGCNGCNQLLNLSICVFYVFICHIPLISILSKVVTPGCTMLHKANNHAGLRQVQPRCNLPLWCNLRQTHRVQPRFWSSRAISCGCTLYSFANRTQCESHPTCSGWSGRWPWRFRWLSANANQCWAHPNPAESQAFRQSGPAS